MNTIVYEEKLTGRTHDTSVQKATSDNEMGMQFNVMPWTSLGVDPVWRHAQDTDAQDQDQDSEPTDQDMSK